jgi:hypothetical protein
VTSLLANAAASGPVAELAALATQVRVIAEGVDELDRDEHDLDLAREVSVDSSVVRGHQHAAGARKTLPLRRPQAGRVLPRARRTR